MELLDRMLGCHSGADPDYLWVPKALASASRHAGGHIHLCHNIYSETD
ncbi:MAG: hypothetical protein HY676_00490 [Chloroflexi bacterium]|nr:hypothetical protein [Chloroflexota bacterium]